MNALPAGLNLANDFFLHGRRVLGIVGPHMFRTWELMQRLLYSRKLDLSPSITHRFGLHQLQEAITMRRSTHAAVGKVVMSP